MGVALVLVALVGALGPSARAAPSPASLSISFASLPSPTAVAASPDRLVALSGASCAAVYTVAANGSVSTFATLVTSVRTCDEVAIAISPGLGNFPVGEVYVLQAGQLFEIPAIGSTTPVAPTLSFSNLTSGKMGLTFDSSGSFGFTLIAVGGRSGEAVEINATNADRAIGSFGTIVEGAAVAPQGFGPLGGKLLVTTLNGSTLDAMNSTGSVRSYPAGGPTSEALSFIPKISCSFSTTSDAYFVADASKNTIQAVPAAAFAKVSGQGLVIGESGGVRLLLPNGTTTSFLRMGGNLEGASFVACPVGAAQGFDLRSSGLNGPSLNIIGYDPAAQELIGNDLTNAPSEIFLLNASTLGFVGNVSTGLDPVAVAYNPQTDTLYVANSGSDNLTVLNASTLHELGNISTGLGSAPVGLAYNIGNQKLYAANSGNDSIDVFSLANKVFPNKNQILLLPGQPLGLVVDPKDGDTYAVGNVAGNGTVWEIHAFKVVATLTVGTDALAIDVNNGTGALYATCYGSNELAIVAPGDNLTATVPIFEPIGVAFNPHNGLAFVDGGDGQVSIVRGITVVASYYVGANPGPLVYDPVTFLAYCAADVTIFGIDPRIIIGNSG